MTKKEIVKNEIEMKMRSHLNREQMAILENILSEVLYHFEIIEVECLPATLDATNEYILDLYEIKKGSRLSPETMRAYMITFKEFVRYVDKPLTQMAQEDVEYYLRMKYREGNSTVSLNNKRRKLNALLEWMRCTATRKGEIPDVKISQVDWQKGQVMIYGSKGRAYRIVCLDSVALKYLREYINERGVDLMSDQPLFTHCRGDMQKALSKSGIYSEIKRIADDSGITRRVYPHLFRKTTATNILKRGGTDSDAGEYLGHKPQGVTARHYAFRSEDHTVKIFESFVAMI